MVTRAINLKVIVPRQADEAGSATAIWSTHREVNLATRYYEEMLLTLRQRPIIYRDGTEQDAEEVRHHILMPTTFLLLEPNGVSFEEHLLGWFYRTAGELGPSFVNHISCFS